jgi:hypothetical protein
MQGRRCHPTWGFTPLLCHSASSDPLKMLSLIGSLSQISLRGVTRNVAVSRSSGAIRTGARYGDQIREVDRARIAITYVLPGSLHIVARRGAEKCFQLHIVVAPRP